jgi:hypothetical protein
MFYLKINEKIKELLNLSDQNNIKLGCRVYCKHQLIALDEFELLLIELENLNLKKLTKEEIDCIKNSSEKIYFHNTHVCVHENNFDDKNKTTILEKENNNEYEYEYENQNQNNCNNPKKNEVKQIKKNDVNAKFRVSYDFPEEKSEVKLEGLGKQINENSTNQGISMISSFFLIVLGSYYLGIYYLEWSKASSLKLTLIVTIIVFFAEAFLLIIKMHREDNKSFRNKASENIKNNSLAYKLNQKYRDSFNKAKIESRNKVMDSSNGNVNGKEKKD